MSFNNVWSKTNGGWQTQGDERASGDGVQVLQTHHHAKGSVYQQHLHTATLFVHENHRFHEGTWSLFECTAAASDPVPWIELRHTTPPGEVVTVNHSLDDGRKKALANAEQPTLPEYLEPPPQQHHHLPHLHLPHPHLHMPHLPRGWHLHNRHHDSAHPEPLVLTGLVDINPNMLQVGLCVGERVVAVRIRCAHAHCQPTSAAGDTLAVPIG